MYEFRSYEDVYLLRLEPLYILESHAFNQNWNLGIDEGKVVYVSGMLRVNYTLLIIWGFWNTVGEENYL